MIKHFDMLIEYQQRKLISITLTCQKSVYVYAHSKLSSFRIFYSTYVNRIDKFVFSKTAEKSTTD